ncbi:hypothetical protein OPV22_005963 [Ensete ventricosum]|uniref:Dolichol-phosphate mannosyltransferase subunit 3 n=1 Tax=Ensete ventricosum TaxID=4639 RepID=A0AAV8Q2W0_ENSVE|nr:hypothetical protein OPV22_005963 [Ensete ventricosum]
MDASVTGLGDGCFETGDAAGGFTEALGRHRRLESSDAGWLRAGGEGAEVGTGNCCTRPDVVVPCDPSRSPIASALAAGFSESHRLQVTASNLLEASVVPRSYTWLLPVYLVVSLGCYGLLMVGVGLMLFPTCPHEASLLQKDIIEAKEFLKSRGVDVGAD